MFTEVNEENEAASGDDFKPRKMLKKRKMELEDLTQAMNYRFGTKILRNSDLFR
jgi:hypothetical protein